MNLLRYEHNSPLMLALQRSEGTYMVDPDACDGEEGGHSSRSNTIDTISTLVTSHDQYQTSCVRYYSPRMSHQFFWPVLFLHHTQRQLLYCTNWQRRAGIDTQSCRCYCPNLLWRFGLSEKNLDVLQCTGTTKHNTDALWRLSVTGEVCKPIDDTPLATLVFTAAKVHGEISRRPLKSLTAMMVVSPSSYLMNYPLCAL